MKGFALLRICMTAYSRRYTEASFWSEPLWTLEGSAENARATVFSLRTGPSGAQLLAVRLRRIAEEETKLVAEPPQVLVESSGATRELLPDVEEHICQITSEACRNALRHARASLVRIEVRFASNDFQLVVKDDGVGISPDILRYGRPNHFGMTGMRERAARISAHFHIESAEGQGTEISFTLDSADAYRSG